jgi:hypothetical protein
MARDNSTYLCTLSVIVQCQEVVRSLFNLLHTCDLWLQIIQETLPKEGFIVAA